MHPTQEPCIGLKSRDASHIFDAGEEVQLEIQGYIGTYEEYPEELRDNEYIRTGYRIGYKGLKNGFRVMFMKTNETFNFWSHVIGKLMFIGFLVYIAVVYPNMDYLGSEIKKEYLSYSSMPDLEAFVDSKL